MIDNLNENFAGQFRHSQYLAQVIAAMQDHRDAPGQRLILRTVPDDSNVSVAALGTYEGRVTLPANTRLFALSGTSAEAAGFDLQLRQTANGAAYFGKRTFFSNATGSAAGSTPQNPQHFLARPLLIVAPGDLLIQIWNRAAVPNAIQLVLWFAGPEDAQ